MSDPMADIYNSNKGSDTLNTNTTENTIDLERVKEHAALWAAENDDRADPMADIYNSNRATLNRTTAARNAFNRANVQTTGSVSAAKLRTTFLTLVGSADDWTGETEIGTSRLADRASIPERTVERALSVLTAYGWVSVTVSGVKGKSNARRAVHWGHHITPDGLQRQVNGNFQSPRNRYLFSEEVREVNMAAAEAMATMAKKLPEPPPYRADGNYYVAADWDQGEPPF